MSIRRLAQEAAAALLQRHAAIAEIAPSFSRTYSSLPEDIAKAARQARFPPRRHVPPSTAAEAAAAESSAATTGEALNIQKEGATIATSWMFPWERRQMEGGKLRSWEKLYWGVFVVAVSLFLVNRARDWTAEDPAAEEEIKKEKEAKKLEKARLVLAGASMVEEEEDPFEGLSPEEVQKYVEEATGASSQDPFEGMTPEEINAYVEEHNLQR